MSGRLIILPKKSYCPWKPENVERVLRDQERHRRDGRVDDEEESALNVAAHQRARLLALSQQRHQQQQQSYQRRRNEDGWEGGRGDEEGSGVTTGSSGGGGDGGGGGLRHINLFEAEERVEQARTRRIEHDIRREMMESTEPPTSSMSEPRPPNHRESGRISGPFYLRDRPYSSTSSETLRDRSDAFVAREERRKAESDPMAAFVDASESDIIVTKHPKRPTAAAANGSTSSTALVVVRSHAKDVRGEDDDDDDGGGSTSSSSISESSHDKKRRRRRRRKEKKKRRRDEERHSRREGRRKKRRRRTAEGLGGEEDTGQK